MAIALVSGIIQLVHLSNIYKKFNTMKFRFAKKREDRSKRMQKLQTANEEEKKNLNEGSEEGESEEKEDLQKSTLKKTQSITDVLLSTNGENVPDWGELSISDKIKLFDPFNVILIISSILILIGSLWISVGGIQVYQTGEYILGFGAFLAWISLPKSYENAK